MFISIILFINLFFTTADQHLDTGYCDSEGKSCNQENVETFDKYLFYDVNPPEGFNLRRDVYMRFAIMLAEAQRHGDNRDWSLVLPPWYKIYHWRSAVSKAKPTPWSTFFDIASLKSYAPVLELHEVFSRYPKNYKKFELDTLFVLQNYEDPFEGGTFVEKWEVNDKCEYDGQFWGYKNITAKRIVCVKFQGKIANLWNIVKAQKHLESVKERYFMFSHGEIPLHDNYGTKPYWDCRKSMKFNKELEEIAQKFIRNHLSCDTVQCNSYLGLHWRRQDFAQSRTKDIPSTPSTVKQVDEFIKQNCPDVKKIFVATDASTKEINTLEKDLAKLGYQVFFYLPSKKVSDTYKDGGIAIIEQIICSHAHYFIGTHESTFTFRIQEEREILGFDSKTSFNRLCPDHGKCQKMSQWTIVH